MSREQRIHNNFALHMAQQYALAHNLPLAVMFTVLPAMPTRAREHFDFMISGLVELEKKLAAYNIPFMLTFGTHTDTIKSFIHHTNPSVIFTDFSPLHGTRTWQKTVATLSPLIVIDSHNIVPVWKVSTKQEYGARTLRPKIHTLLGEYLVEAPSLTVHPYSWPGVVMTTKDLTDKIEFVARGYKANNTKQLFVPGEAAAVATMNDFITKRLKGYAAQRNNPSVDGLSNLSPFLHFGSLASLTVVLAAQKAAAQNPSLQQDVDTLIEEMVVRKELSDNYCYYNSHYTSLAGVADWAQKTLQKHANDEREFLYSRTDFEDAKTHDPAWNAAQLQLRKEGKIHGYMRMYWAKKVLEWSASPEEALRTLLYLNDFYSIDGGDPNGYVGILWSIGGLHDRPWGERPVYGTIRSMVYSGLQKKFDIKKYIEKYN
jgi:deoxyribodipyrimidine photo-lyase